MGFRMGTAYTETALVTELNLALFTDIGVLPPLNVPIDNAIVFLFWSFEVDVAAGGNSIEIVLHRGDSTTGVLIQDLALGPWAPGDNRHEAGCTVDRPGVVAEQIYTLGAAMGGATANSPIADVRIIALML